MVAANHANAFCHEPTPSVHISGIYAGRDVNVDFSECGDLTYGGWGPFLPKETPANTPPTTTATTTTPPSPVEEALSATLIVSSPPAVGRGLLLERKSTEVPRGTSPCV